MALFSAGQTEKSAIKVSHKGYPKGFYFTSLPLGAIPKVFPGWFYHDFDLLWNRGSLLQVLSHVHQNRILVHLRNLLLFLLRYTHLNLIATSTRCNKKINHIFEDYQKYCKIYPTPFLLPYPYQIFLPQPDCFRRQFRQNFPDGFITSLIYLGIQNSLK